MRTIAEKIRRRRVELGLTQSDLARRCGLPPVTIWHIEKGRGNPGLKSVVLIAKALGLCVDWLVREEDVVLDCETREMLEMMKKLTPKNKKKVHAFVKSIYRQKGKKSGSKT